MKYILFSIVGFLSFFPISFGAEEKAGGIFGNSTGSLTKEQVRSGDIHLKDIPNIIKGMIDFFMGIAGTIAIIFIIIGAYQFLFGSFKQDRTSGKNTIVMAISGFIIASLAWFIIKFIIDNFS